MSAREDFSAREVDRAVAHSRLMAAITAEVEAGSRVPCVEPDTAYRWTSDDGEDLFAAAEACQRCPAIEACRTYIENNVEVAGVYAGLTPLERTNR